MISFNINSIAGQWKKLVIDIVKNGNYEDEKLKKKAYHIASELYHKNTRFFFDIAKNDLNNNIKAIKYIGRYLSRAPIAEYKIIDYSDGNITFYYEDLANNKERVELTLDVETWDTFQVNPFYCFKCHVKMRIKEITYFSSRAGSIRYKEYSY